MKRLIAVSGSLEAYQTGWEDRYGYATPIGFVRTEDGDVPVDDLFTVITRPYWEQVAEVVLDDAMEKGRPRQFSSRSEAGRYAAQVRWGNRNREAAGGEPASGLATGEFQTVLEPTDDAQEAIETGRPWRPLLDESMPPELRQIMAAFESSVRKSSEDRDLTDITGYNQVLEALTRHYEGVLAKGPWDQNLANKRYGSVWVKDGAVKPRQVAEEMAAYRFRGIRADAVRARTWHGTAEKSDEETKAVAGVLLTRQKHVVINMDDATVLKMIGDGRIKTQFETRTSGGYLGNGMRATHEAVHYGIHPFSSGAMRPVYGTIHANGVFSNRLNGTTQYGKAIVVLKPEVHNRTTFALNDTLGSGRIHNPLNGPLTNRGGSQDLNRQSYAMVSKKAQFHGYIEAQVHGGVGLGDIAMILMDSPQAIAKARAAMKAAGLPEGMVRLAREGKESKFIYPPEVAKSDALPMRSIMVDIIQKARERRFSSRSEAARYAAEVRWRSQNQGEASESRRANLTETARTDDQRADGAREATATFEFTAKNGDTVVLHASTSKAATRADNGTIYGSYRDDPRYGFSPEWFEGTQSITVDAYVGGKKVGFIDCNELRIYAGRQKNETIGTPTGLVEITHIGVSDGHKRQGIATALVTAAERMAFSGKRVVHSQALSEDGAAFVSAVKSTDAIDKARERRFSSRSEAGRYAAQVRWGNRGAAAGGAERSPTMQAIADEAAAIKVEMDAINALGAADVFGQIPRMDPSKSTYDRATAPVVVDSRDGELTVSPRVAELHDRTLRLGRAMDDEAHRRTEEELKSVEGGVVPDRNAIYAKHLQAVVAEVRPCNGKVEWVGDSVLASNPKIREQMDASMAEVGRVMPRDWTAVTGGTPIPVTMRTMGEGSSYNMVRQDITMALPKNVESRSFGQTDYTAIVGHEYTHHVEMTRPAVRVMEVAFVAHRTTGLAQEQTTRWKFVNGKQEPNDAPKAAPLKDRVKATQRSPRDIAVSAGTGQYLALNKDHFAAAYSGRLYRDPYTRTNPDGGMTLMPKPSSRMDATSQAFEVLTTGVEQVFTGNRANFDADHMSFVLGVMATA